MNVPFIDSSPPTEFTVVGERRDDPSLFLLLGEDGNYYAYSLTEGTPISVEPDDHWRIEALPEHSLPRDRPARS